MIDNQFDNFVNGKLKDHAAPVPAGLWDKVTEGQFDNFIGDKLRDREAPVPADLWDRITDTQFDSFMGNTLANHVAPVPAGLWDKIQPRNRDDRKGFVLFRNPGMAILLAALLLGTLGSYLYFTKGKNQPVSTTTLLPNTKGPNTSGRPQDALLPGGPASAAINAPTEKNSREKTAQAAEEGKANSTSLHSPAKDIGDASALTGISRQAAGGQPSTKLDLPQGSNNLSLSSIALHKSKAPGQESSQLSSDPGAPAARNEMPAGMTLNRNFTPKAKVPANYIATPSRTTINETNFGFIEPYRSNLLTAVIIPSPVNRNNSTFSLSDKQLVAGNHTSQFRNIIICPSDRKNRNTDLYVEAYVSPDIAVRSLSNISASRQYLARKDSSSSMQLGYSGGIRLVKPITENILLKAGLQYTQMNEKFVYRTENEVKTTTVVTVRKIIRAPGDTVIVSDTTVLQQIGFKNNTVSNRYRSFDIPVTLGYQFGNEDLKFGINAGVVVNLSSWYEGVILDSSLSAVPLTKSNNMVYKSKVGMGLYAGFSIVKKLGDDLHVFVEPYFRYNLSNMTTSQSSYNQKFSLGGVSVGLRFNLNRQ